MHEKAIEQEMQITELGKGLVEQKAIIDGLYFRLITVSRPVKQRSKYRLSSFQFPQPQYQPFHQQPYGYNILPSMCNGCGMNPIGGIRYKCRSCYNYDLCHLCRIRGLHRHHSFALIQRPYM